MKTLKFNIYLIPLILLVTSYLSAQHQHDHSQEHSHEQSGNRLGFIQNLGQWETPVRYQVGLGSLNALFLEEQTFTYLFHDSEQSKGLHDAFFHDKVEDYIVDAHAYKVHFSGANQARISGLQKRNSHYNYFLGNDQSKWTSDVPVFDKIQYENLYDNINLEAYSEGDDFKYDFVVLPQGDVSQIQLEYEGVSSLDLKNGALIITTPVETIHELEPYAWQLIDGEKRKVPCEYKINNNTVSFHFPEGYNHNISLTIDPVVIAATLSGTTNNQNFGHTATFDSEGNIYTGGISFGPGYPTNSGSFQVNFGGGSTDICVSKYNPDGSQMLYATYIGGSDRDHPHSMITDFSGQLYIYGSTLSNNFPVNTNAVQTNHGGQEDIIVVKLNATGSQLVGSTYIGGSSADGQDKVSYLDNYGDDFRGEIIIDAQGNAYVTSNTQSSDFPVTSSAFDEVYNSNMATSGSAAQDAVAFKLNSDFSTLFWSTFLGGDGPDTGGGLRLDDNNNVYITGTAGGSNFPNTGTGYQSAFLGGTEDAYVLLLSADGRQLLHSTFFGTTNNDHSYFIDIDEENNVHIYGQTTGVIAPTPGTYSTNNNSPQFLAAFNSNLTQLIYATNIGTGPISGSDFQFVPVAFMVDKCNNIYFSGYYAHADLPTTPDAILTTGSDMFYLGVLDPLATGLSYGTYYGNADHVDGGTSRFDKSGTVYQGVCSCTWSGSVLNTTSNAWDTANDLDCDVGVFKIDFEVPTVTAAAFASPATSGCLPFDVDFTYTGQDAEQHFWDFGDGTTSTLVDPNHTFTETGKFTVTMIASSPQTCNIADTFYLDIDVLDGSSTLQDTAICQGLTTLFLDATTTNATYQWNDGSTGATLPVSTPGIYWVEVDIGTCSRLDSFVINPATDMSVNLGDDLSVCDELNYDIVPNLTGPIVSYEWNSGATSQTINVSSAGSYSLSTTDEVGCILSDTVDILFGFTPNVELGVYDTLCEGETVSLDVSTPNVSYLWQDGSQEATYTVSEGGDYFVTLDNNGCFNSDTVSIVYFEVPDYTATINNIICTGECNGSIELSVEINSGPLEYSWSTGSTDSFLENLCEGDYDLTITDQHGCTYEEFYSILNPDPLIYDLDFESVVCFGDQDGYIEILGLSGGFPPYDFILNGDTLSESPILDNLSGGTYEVVVSDSGGCSLSDTVFIYEPPFLNIFAGDDRYIELGDTVHVNGYVHPIQNQILTWDPLDRFLGCIDCPTPVVQPVENMAYILSATDIITGCVREDTVMMYVDKIRKIYIPNAFSPNYDGVNDVFVIYSGPGVEAVLSFKIFDRWGEQVFESLNFQPNDRTYGWDGTFKQEDMNNGVFVYVAEVLFIDGEKLLYSGDVSLLK